MGFIYKLTNLENGNFYIGSTIRPKYKRKYEHFRDLRRNSHKNNHLQNAFNKYGESNFKFEVLEEVPLPKEWSKLEKVRYLVKIELNYVSILNPEYNIDRIIESTGKAGHIVTEETKKKLSEAHRKRLEGKPVKQSTLDKRDRESRRINGVLIRKPRPYPSEETRKKLSEASKKRVWPKKKREFLNPNLDGNILPKQLKRLGLEVIRKIIRFILNKYRRKQVKLE